MSRTTKKSPNRFSILVVCVIAIIVFAALSLYAMITPPTTGLDSHLSSNKLQSAGNSIGMKVEDLPDVPVMSILPNRTSVPDITVKIYEEKNEVVGEWEKDKVLIGTHSSNISSTSTLHAVTYASHGGRDDRFCRAIESAIRHEVELIILGWGVKWKGLSQKLEAAHNFAKSLPKNDIILFTDAFDVMFTNTPKHILKTYQELASQGTDIIFAGECGCWPHVTIDHGRPCFDKYPKSPTPYRYLNSGTWIGKAAPSAEMLHAVQIEAGKDFANANDQELVANMFMEGRFGIALDYYAKLFQSMHLTLDKPLPYCKPIDDIEVVGRGQLFNKRTGTYPAVFHFNGGGKRYHLDLEGRLWYKKSPYNSAVEMEHLRSHRLRVPIASDKERTLQFGEICPDYFKSNGDKKSVMHREQQFLRQDRKTPRGRSIKFTRASREY